jgi:uncharacterized cupin superfamily protein
MNINVSARKGVYDAFDLSDGRVGAALDPIPTFMTMRLDQSLLRPATGPAPTAAKGTVQYRRALPPSVFRGPWAYVDHVVLAPGSATAPHAYQEIGEFWYVMNGTGTVKVGSESASIQSGDAVPIQLNQTKSFENTWVIAARVACRRSCSRCGQEVRRRAAAGARRARQLKAARYRAIARDRGPRRVDGTRAGRLFGADAALVFC